MMRLTHRLSHWSLEGFQCGLTFHTRTLASFFCPFQLPLIALIVAGVRRSDITTLTPWPGVFWIVERSRGEAASAVDRRFLGRRRTPTSESVRMAERPNGALVVREKAGLKFSTRPTKFTVRVGP